MGARWPARPYAVPADRRRCPCTMRALLLAFCLPPPARVQRFCWVHEEVCRCDRGGRVSLAGPGIVCGSALPSQPHPPSLQGCSPAAGVLRRLPGRPLVPEAWQAGAAAARTAAGAPGTAMPAATAASQLLRSARPAVLRHSSALSSLTVSAAPSPSALQFAPLQTAAAAGPLRRSGLAAALGGAAPGKPAGQALAAWPALQPASTRLAHTSSAAAPDQSSSNSTSAAVPATGDERSTSAQPASGSEAAAKQQLERWLETLREQGYTAGNIELETDKHRLTMSMDGDKVNLSIRYVKPYRPEGLTRLGYLAIGCSLAYLAFGPGWAFVYFIICA